jgi:hypothetical protein
MWKKYLCRALRYPFSWLGFEPGESQDQTEFNYESTPPRPEKPEKQNFPNDLAAYFKPHLAGRLSHRHDHPAGCHRCGFKPKKRAPFEAWGTGD